MQRDMDLCRAILLEIAGHPSPLTSNAFLKIEIDGYSQEQIWYHIKLLSQAGLMEAIDYTTQRQAEWLARDLTWQGHEFLDAYRDNTRWQTSKQILQKAVGSLTLEGLKQLIPKLVGEGLEKI